jgi:hypothetical protein
MDDPDPFEAVMWREGSHRCELWQTDVGHELRLYVSDVLTYREPPCVSAAADCMSRPQQLAGPDGGPVAITVIHQQIEG